MKKGIYYVMVFLGLLSCSAVIEKSNELGVDFNGASLSTNNYFQATEGEKYIDNYEVFLYCRSTSSVLFQRRYKRGQDSDALFSRWTLGGLLPDEYNLLLLTNSSETKSCVSSWPVNSGKFVVNRELTSGGSLPGTIRAAFSGSDALFSEGVYAVARVCIQSFTHHLENDADDMDVYAIWLGDVSYACSYDVDLSAAAITKSESRICNEDGEPRDLRNVLFQTTALTLGEGENVDQPTRLYFFPYPASDRPTRLVFSTSRGYYNFVLPEVLPGQSIEIKEVIFKGKGGVTPYDPGILDVIFNIIDVRSREDMDPEVVVL